MTIKRGPNSGMLVDGAPGEAHYNDLMHQWRWLDFFANPAVQSIATANPPAGVDGAAYIVGPSPTGAWVGHTGKIARFTTALSPAQWEFFTPKEGTALVYNRADKQRYQFLGGSWYLFAQGGESGGSATGDIIMSISDMETPLTTGTGRAYAPIPRPGTISGVKANLRVASTSGAVTLDIRKNGVSILSAPLTIPANQVSSLAAAVQSQLTQDQVKVDDILRVDILSGGTGAKGLTATLLFSPVIEDSGGGGGGGTPGSVNWGSIGGLMDNQPDVREAFAARALNTTVDPLIADVAILKQSLGKVVTQIGDGTRANFYLTHNLGTYNVHVTVYRSASPRDTIIVDVSRTTEDEIEISGFSSAPAVNEYTVIVSA